jgi:twitching motility two-component system response regulator PilG
MGKLVMVIDDSPPVRKIVEVCLRRQGIDCLSYADGVEAMRAIVTQQAQLPDVVLLDIGLPRLDGYRIAQMLKARHPQRPIIIMLSGRDSVVDRLKGRLAGATAYLIKPFRTEELMAVINEHLTPPEPATSSLQP